MYILTSLHIRTCTHTTKETAVPNAFNKLVSELEPGDLVSFPHEGEPLSISFAILRTEKVHGTLQLYISDSVIYNSDDDDGLYYLQEGNPFTWDAKNNYLMDCNGSHADWFTERMWITKAGAQKAFEVYRDTPRIIKNPVDLSVCTQFMETPEGDKLWRIVHAMVQNNEIADFEHRVMAFLEMLGLKPDIRRTCLTVMFISAHYHLHESEGVASTVEDEVSSLQHTRH